jgi:hypothetical protein
MLALLCLLLDVGGYLAPIVAPPLPVVTLALVVVVPHWLGNWL